MSKTGTPGESPPDGMAPDQRHEHPTTPEIDSDALAARLRLPIGDHTVSFFARKKCGFAESVLRTHLNDGRMPPLDKALAMAAAGSVTLDWLATGRGRRVTGEILTADTTASRKTGDGQGAEIPTLDPIVLEGILKIALQAPGACSTPEHLAALTVDLYRPAMILDQQD